MVMSQQGICSMQNISEKDVHISIVEYLNHALPRGSLIHHSANEGRRHVRHAVNLKRMGLHTGWPDLEVIVPRQFFWIEFHWGPFFLEVKAPGGKGRRKGKVSKAQRQTLDMLRAAGCYTAVVHSIDEVIAELSKYIMLESDYTQ